MSTYVYMVIVYGFSNFSNDYLSLNSISKIPAALNWVCLGNICPFSSFLRRGRLTPDFKSSLLCAYAYIFPLIPVAHERVHTTPKNNLFVSTTILCPSSSGPPTDNAGDSEQLWIWEMSSGLHMEMVTAVGTLLEDHTFKYQWIQCWCLWSPKICEHPFWPAGNTNGLCLYWTFFEKEENKVLMALAISKFHGIKGCGGAQLFDYDFDVITPACFTIYSFRSCLDLFDASQSGFPQSPNFSMVLLAPNVHFKLRFEAAILSAGS